VNLQQKHELGLPATEFAGHPASIALHARSAADRRKTPDKKGKGENDLGFPGLKTVQDIFKQALHAGVAQVFIPVFQRLYKATHVRALESGGQLHAEFHRGHAMLGATFTLADSDG
jgi:hypothetical protein